MRLKKCFFGDFDVSKCSKELVDEAIEEVIDGIFEIEYNGQVETDARSFGEALRKCLMDSDGVG